MRFSDRLLGRWLPVAALTVVGAAAAAVFAYTAANRYDATAQLIVSPVSASDPTYLGLGLLRDTGGKRTAAASAAVMLRSPQVADAVRTQLGLTRSRDSLLAALHAHAVSGSDVVDVTVRDTSPVRAAQLANAFVNALVQQRTASFQSQLTSVIRRVQAQIAALPPNQRTIGVGAALQQRLTVLQSLQGQPDPSIRPADQAEAPSRPAWPNRPLIVGAGAGAGLLLGLLVVGIVALVRRKPAPREAPSKRSVDLLAAGPARAAEPSPELRRLERELEQRAASVAAREEQADARNEELERRTTELEERAHELERRTGELESRTETQIEEANAREAEARSAAEYAAEERAAAEARAAEERDARVREAEERAAAEARAAEEREAREAAEREQAAREQAAREQAEREAQERAEAERTAREATERVAAEREAAEREAAEREAAERRAAIAAPAPLPLEPVLAGAPAYRPAAPANGVAGGHWNLVELERLVEERGGEFPDRLDEWASYLFFLRDYADPDGSVPASFDWLIEDEFAEIV